MLHTLFEWTNMFCFFNEWSIIRLFQDFEKYIHIKSSQSMGQLTHKHNLHVIDYRKNE